MLLEFGPLVRHLFLELSRASTNEIPLFHIVCLYAPFWTVSIRVVDQHPTMLPFRIQSTVFRRIWTLYRTKTYRRILQRIPAPGSQHSILARV